MTDVSTRDVILALLVVIAVAILLVILARWLGRQVGTDGRFRVRARCRDGHVFTTTWLPLFLLPVPRIGLVRFQYLQLPSRFNETATEQRKYIPREVLHERSACAATAGTGNPYA